MAAASLDKILSKFVHIQILDTIPICPSANIVFERKKIWRRTFRGFIR